MKKMQILVFQFFFVYICKKNQAMKKILLSIILYASIMGISYAQVSKETVLQPTNVIARQLDESGQVVKEVPSLYSYGEDGKLTGYELPGHSLTSSYWYSDNLLVMENINHNGGWPIYGESFNYAYENGRIKTKSHLWNQMNAPEYWLYSYDLQGRLERMDYRDGYEDEYHMHYLYEYEDDDKTKIENYWTSWNTQGLVLRKKTIFHYDDAFRLLSMYVENYSVEGELTKTTKTTYTYVPNGKEESEIMQTLTDGEWVNTEMIRYVYDDNERLAEWQVGNWSDEIGDWDITSKAVYELDEEELTWTVTFYKKDGEQWGWEDYSYMVYHIQPVFDEPYLMEQEHALRYYGYDDLFGCEHINQFVFTLVETDRPEYVGAVENTSLSCGVYPNPGHDMLKVEAAAEDAVIRIYNMQGQLVMAKPFAFTTEINAQKWSAGVYVWEISQGNQKVATGKWVKE